MVDSSKQASKKNEEKARSDATQDETVFSLRIGLAITYNVKQQSPGNWVVTGKRIQLYDRLDKSLYKDMMDDFLDVEHDEITNVIWERNEDHHGYEWGEDMARMGYASIPKYLREDHLLIKATTLEL